MSEKKKQLTGLYYGLNVRLMQTALVTRFQTLLVTFSSPSNTMVSRKKTH